MSVCPECGGHVAEIIKGSSQTFTCESCGWSIARSWTEPINEDETIYVIGIVPGQIANRAKLSAVSKAANCNFITAKQIIEEGRDNIVSCKAREMKELIEDLRTADVKYVVNPKFVY